MRCVPMFSRTFLGFLANTSLRGRLPLPSNRPNKIFRTKKNTFVLSFECVFPTRIYKPLLVSSDADGVPLEQHLCCVLANTANLAENLLKET